MAFFNSIVLKILQGYRYLVSPSYVSCCRFLPTCSQYASDCYASFGFFKATYLTCKRLCRCHPWGRFGVDSIPTKGGNS